MKSVKNLNAKILEITILIKTKYPELSKYLSEMPDTFSTEKKPGINSDILENYFNSLDQLLKKYILKHPKKQYIL